MADDADKSASGVLNTPGDEKRDGKSPEADASTPASGSTGKADKAPGTFGDTPKKRGRPPGSKNRKPLDATTAPEGKSKAWLTKRLNALLKSPGFAFEMSGDPWAVQHIDARAPDLAKALADHAERNPAFRARLIAFLDGGETAGLVFASIMYAAPLAIYFGILPIPEHFRARLPIPARGGTMPDLASVAGEPGAPTQEALEAEAHAKGFDDLGDYMNAVQVAIANVQGPGVTEPPHV